MQTRQIEAPLDDERRVLHNLLVEAYAALDPEGEHAELCEKIFHVTHLCDDGHCVPLASLPQERGESSHQQVGQIHTCPICGPECSC